jgi:hypothetical protein
LVYVRETRKQRSKERRNKEAKKHEGKEAGKRRKAKFIGADRQTSEEASKRTPKRICEQQNNYPRRARGTARRRTAGE